MCTLNQIFINRCYEPDSRPKLRNIVPKPLFSSLVMGAAAWLTYTGLEGMMGGADISRMKMAAAMLAAIIVGVAVYVFAAVKTKAVTAADMSLMPKGDKITRLLHL